MVSGHLVYNFDRWIWPALLLRQNWLRWLQFVNGRLKFWRHLTKFYEKCRTNSKRFRNNLSSDVVCNRIFVFRVKNLMGHNLRMSITEYGQCYCRSVCFFLRISFDRPLRKRSIHYVSFIYLPFCTYLDQMKSQSKILTWFIETTLTWNM